MENITFLEKQSYQEPKCVHFGECGGCKFQDIPYQEQIFSKERFVLKCFGPLLDQKVQIEKMVPCDDPWNYRNKMEFSFSEDKKGNRYLGLYKKKGRVVDLSECHLVHPWFIHVLKEVRVWWKETQLKAYHPYSNKGSLRTLTLREGVNTGERMAILTVSGNPDYALTKNHLESFVKRIGPYIEKGGIFLQIQQIKKGMETQFYLMKLFGKETIAEKLHVGDKTLTFTVSPQAFFQPNTRQAEKLYEKAIKMAQITKEDVVYDLYCGTATLGILASFYAKEVISVELSLQAVIDAKQNVANNHVKNLTVYQGDVAAVLESIDKKPDIVIVDPPRTGLLKAVKPILSLLPKKILYISCNPVTQAEDIKILVEKGYLLKAICPVDQFPHTRHIENIAVLEKK